MKTTASSILTGFKSILGEWLALAVKTLNLGKVLSRFLDKCVISIVSLRGKVNFLQLGRYSDLNEKTFRNNFSKRNLNWVELNAVMIDKVLPHPSDRVIALDPAHISKSGRCTPGIGMYWSGASGKSVYGLELTDFAAIDYKTGDCLMLGAEQSLPEQSDGSVLTMTECYLKALKDRSDNLLKISNIIVADSFFARKTFVLPALDLGFTMVSKLPINASLRYIANDEYIRLRGVRRGYQPIYAGKVEVSNMDAMFTESLYIEGIGKFHTAVVYSVSLKRNIRIVVGRIGDRDNVILFTTDVDMEASRVVAIYRKRFRIEFGIRDAKQFTGLNHNQARNTDRIDFAYNVSFFTRNVLQTEVKLLFPNLSVGQLKKVISDTVFALKILEIGAKGENPMTQSAIHRLIATYAGVAA